MGKLTSNRNNARARTQAAPTIKTESDVVLRAAHEGDGALAWIRANAPDCVTDAELASVELQGIDLVADVPFHHHVLYDQSLITASVDEVRAYFTREAPDTLQSDDGARLNGLHRERAERDNTPGGRWGMVDHLASSPT